MGIENLVEKFNDKLLEVAVKLSDPATYKRYGVDVLSGWIYYTPTYALQELVAGKDSEAILKTRLIGLGVHAIVMRPVGMVRNYVAKKWNVTKDSSAWDKIKVNLIGVTPIQSVAYAGMLIGGMAWSDEWNWGASAIAWGIGVGIGAGHSIPYGFVQDKIRKVFGVKPAIAKKENLSESKIEYINSPNKKYVAK
jgi:hypothetical protein